MGFFHSPFSLSTLMQSGRGAYLCFVLMRLFTQSQANIQELMRSRRTLLLHRIIFVSLS